MYLQGAVGPLIERVKEDCIHCARAVAAGNSDLMLPIHPIVCTEPDELWVMDHTDVVRDPVTGYNSVWHCVDHFTKFGFAIPVKTKSAAETIDCLRRAIAARGGVRPKRLLSDNGRAFVNSEVSSIRASRTLAHVPLIPSSSAQMDAFLQENNIIESHGLPYRPNVQGAVERRNATLKRKACTCTVSHKCQVPRSPLTIWTSAYRTAECPDGEWHHLGGRAACCQRRHQSLCEPDNGVPTSRRCVRP